MRSHIILIGAYATVACGAPGGPWHWGSWGSSHPGWYEPSVYTPPGPEITYHSTSAPGPVPTSYSVTPPATVNATSSAASSSSSSSSSSSAPVNNACASVSRLLAASSSSSSAAYTTPTVPAGLAYECITSVPFNQSAAVALLDSIRPYLNWQTTITYLKDPPAEYAEKVQPPYDFYADYERIYNKAKAGAYQNEYAFGFDLYRSFQKAHDGHFVYYPDSVTLIFSFGRTTPLVSVSLDGESIPEVYVYADILESSFGNNSYAPSPLRKIDGQDSTEFLFNFSQYGSLQDRDALWNNMFYLLAQVSLGPYGTGTGTFSGGGRGRWIYPGPTTTLEFANGTSVTNENFANVLVPFDGIQSGQDIYRKFFIPPPGEPETVEELVSSSSYVAPSSSYSYSSFSYSSAAVSSSFSYSSVASSSSYSYSYFSSSTSTSLAAPGYPTPVIREMNNLNSGYFLDGDGYDDVAVLSVPSFVGSLEDELPFQSVNTYLINQAVAQGKKKLIIDVSANGGGTILQGYDLFKQLFPQILPYGATRFRAHEAHDLIGEEVSWYSGQVPRSLALNFTALNLVASNFNYRTDVDINYENFDSWPDKFGPNEYGPGPDNFTDIIRWNLSDVLTPINSGGIYVSGYLNRSNITQQPFAPENIVIVYDGYCASTCTIFSELMRQQAGIQTIALGGRPNKDIIQAVGGVKGTNDFPYSLILYYVEKPFQIEHYHDAGYYSNTALGDYDDLAIYRGTAWVVNSRDGIRKGDEDQTPLQFVYEPADCRIYYTPAMAVDQAAAWKTVADTAFNGINNCVAGDYEGSFGKVKRDLKPRSNHGRRRNLDIAEHYRAMAEVWTGKGDIAMNGDSVMIL